MNEDYLTIEEVAEKLKVSEAAVRSYINDEKMPLPSIMLSDRITRIKLSDLIAWTDEKKKSNVAYVEGFGGDGEDHDEMENKL